ncbi:MAG: M48 family metalloprotease, partial [Blastocatellia bacterium]
MGSASLIRDNVGKIIALLFLLLFLAFEPAIARPSSTANLRVTAKADGQATLRINFTLNDSLPEAVRGEIEKALGARLTEKTYVADEGDDDSDSADTDEKTAPRPARKSLHFFDGEGRKALAHSTFIVDGTIDLAPIFAALHRVGIDKAFVAVDHPATAYNYVPPGINTRDFEGLSNQSFAIYNVDLEQPSREQSSLRIAFGYKSDSLAKRFGVLGVLFLLPIFLAIRRRIRYSRSETDDLASIRYGAMRTVNAASLFIPIIWYAAYSISGVRGIVGPALSGRRGFTFNSIDLALLFGPPVISVFVCTLLLSPLLKLEQTGQNRRSLLKQFSSLLLGTYLPWLLVLAGIDAIAKRQFNLLIGFLAASQLLRLISKSILGKDASRQIYPLIGNSLRTKILDMAARSGVAPREIYILTEDANKSANACATSKKTIVLNEFLIKRFTKREVDAVVGHEIGHLRLNHLRIRSIVLYGGIVLALIASRFVWTGVSLLAIAFHPLLRVIPYLYSSDYSY